MADVLKLQSTAGMFDYPDPANPSKGNHRTAVYRIREEQALRVIQSGG